MSTTGSLNTLFRLTLASGVVTAVALHLRRGAPVNGRDAKGRTPLILAAARGHAEVCQLLLDAGADIGLRDRDGRTALVAAQSSGHASVAALLADAEKPAAPDRQGADFPSSGGMMPAADVTTGKSTDTPASDQVTDTVENVQHQDTGLDRLQVTDLQPDPVAEISTVQVAGNAEGSVWLPDEAGFADAQPARSPMTLGEELAGLAASSLLPDTAIRASRHATLVSDEPSRAIWEPEPEPILSLVESGMEAAAASLQAGLTRHRASTSDTDWTSVDVDLPEIWSIWSEGFIEGFDARRPVLDLLATALHEGWLPAEQLEELTAQAIDNHHGASAARVLCSVLESMGVVVEDEHALELSRMCIRTHIDEPAARRMEIESAVRLLADVPNGGPDAETMLVEDAGRAPVLSESEEGSLFRELRESVATMLRLAAAVPSTADVLVRWTGHLTAGHLTPKEISTAEWGNSDAELLADAGTEAGLPAGSMPGEDETDAPGELVDGEERLAIQVLASRLKETANRISLRNDPAPALGSLALTGRRVVELAENVLSVNGRAPRRAARSRIDVRTRLSELHLLRRKAKIRPLPLPDHKIGVALDGYIAARQAIVEGNLRRVMWNARRYSRGPVPFLDLVQEGQIGLLRAIDRFDAERGVRFGTYATWWIRQSIRRAMQDSGRTIRVPVHMLERITKVRRRVEALRVRSGFEPTPADVARDMEVDVRAVERALSADNEIVSLDAVDNGTCEEQDASFLESTSVTAQSVDLPTPLSAILHADLRHRLLAALGRLDPRQARILDLRFGITTGEPMTLEEVGQIYGVTRERIRQVEAKALGRMARLLPRHGFENMLP